MNYQLLTTKLLTELGFGEAVISSWVNSYRKIIDKESTAFNYYKFGKMFCEVRHLIEVRPMDALQRLELHNIVNQLEEYIVPKIVLQTAF